MLKEIRRSIQSIRKNRKRRAYAKRWQKAARIHEWTLYGIPDMNYPIGDLQNFVPYNEEEMKEKM